MKWNIRNIKRSINKAKKKNAEKKAENKTQKRQHKFEKRNAKHQQWTDRIDREFGKLDIGSLSDNDVNSGAEYVDYIIALNVNASSNRS